MIGELLMLPINVVRFVIAFKRDLDRYQHQLPFDDPVGSSREWPS